jgi:hypothetical protein
MNNELKLALIVSAAVVAMIGLAAYAEIRTAEIYAESINCAPGVILDSLAKMLQQ